MQAFDLNEARGFAATIDQRMRQCGNGEGAECANLDETMRQYADICVEYCGHVRQWGHSIFQGHATFDKEVEQIWIDGGRRLYRRALETWQHGQILEGECFVLERGARLGSVLLWLNTLLTEWVSPKRSLSPLVRIGVATSDADREEVRKRIAALPPIPANWQPNDPCLQELLKKRRQGKIP